MFSNSFARLKQIERPAMLLTKALIVLFWLCAGVESTSATSLDQRKNSSFCFPRWAAVYLSCCSICASSIFLFCGLSKKLQGLTK